MKWQSGRILTDRYSNSDHPPVETVLLVGPWPYAGLCRWRAMCVLWLHGVADDTERSGFLGFMAPAALRPQAQGTLFPRWLGTDDRK